MKLLVDKDLALGETRTPVVTIKSPNGKDYTFVYQGDLNDLELGKDYKVTQGWTGMLVSIGKQNLSEVVQHKVTALDPANKKDVKCPICGGYHDLDGIDEIPKPIQELLSKVFNKIFEGIENE